MRKVRSEEGPAPDDGLMLAMDPGLRVAGITVAGMDGRPVDAWLPRSTAKARQVKGERVPAPEGPLAWRGMVGAILSDLEARGHIHRITLLVVEWPEVYLKPIHTFSKAGNKATTNPNDLLELAAVEGGLVCALPALARYERFTPRQWKKSFPKGDYQKAILAALTPVERALVERTTESLRHNVIESVGLARFTATVLAGAPMSVPAFQGRVRPARTPPASPPQGALPLKPAAGAQPASWRQPLPPSSRAGTPSYGSRHPELKAAVKPPPRGSLRTVAQQLRGRATSASHPPPGDE